MNIKLLHLDLLVALDPQPATMTPSHSGTVLLAGPAWDGREDTIKPGDKILIRSADCAYLEVDGRKCALVGDEGVLWRFEGPRPPAPTAPVKTRA
jgi:hypothetical protein